MHTNRMVNASKAVQAAEKHRHPADRWFYVGVTLAMVLLNLVSFAPSIVNPSERTVPLPLTSIDLAHVLVSLTWLLVFLAQVTLVPAGRRAVHRRLGVVGVLLSAALIVVTWFMLIEGARRGFDLSGDLVPKGTTMSPGVFLAPANALVPFGVFVAAAVWCRRRAAVHKRLMMLAMLTTAGAPIAHLIGHWPSLRPLGLLIGATVLIWSLLPVHDRLSQGRIHPVSLWGGVASFVWQTLFFVLIANTSAWQAFAAWLVL